MPDIPNWLIGKHVTAFTITPQTVGTAGALSDGTSQSLVGQLDEIQYSYNAQAEEINALDSTRENNVIITKGNGLRLTEILKKIGTNVLASASNISDVQKVIFTRGAQSTTLYGLVTGYNETIRRGKSVADVILSPIDAGTGTYVYS